MPLLTQLRSVYVYEDTYPLNVADDEELNPLSKTSPFIKIIKNRSVKTSM
jgi:hypothetical protein